MIVPDVSSNLSCYAYTEMNLAGEERALGLSSADALAVDDACGVSGGTVHSAVVAWDSTGGY